MTPIDEYHFQCMECGLIDNHKMDCSTRYNKSLDDDDVDAGLWAWDDPPKECDVDVVDEDWLSGVSCNPDAPEECESCQ